MRKKLLQMLWFVLCLPLAPIFGLHNTIAFCQAPAGNTEEPIAGVADQNARVSGDDIYIGKYNQIISMFGGGKGCATLRLVSPSLRRFLSPYIHPYFSFLTEAYWAVKPVYMLESPIPLETNEALNALIKVGEYDTAKDNFCGVSLAEGPVAPVHGDIRTMVIENDHTGTIRVWTNATLTLPQDLPVGRYAVVGASCRANKPGIFRLVPVGADHRPGGLLEAGVQRFDTNGQRMGKMGVWCEFDQLTPPSLEVCPCVALTWYSLKLDLIKVA